VDEGRPAGNVRFPKGDVRQPKSLVPITGMPTEMTYRDADSVVVLGDGEFGPVSIAVWEYTVGDPADWTTEFIDLLTVLTRLTGLEEQQGDLLDRVLASPLRTKQNLEQSGVYWPAGPQDRTVRNPITALADESTLDLQ